MERKLSTNKLTKFCRRCGTKIPRNSEFCENCGARLVRPEPPHIEERNQAFTQAPQVNDDSKKGSMQQSCAVTHTEPFTFVDQVKTEKTEAVDEKASSQSIETTMFCKECGTKIPRDSKFCMNCGTKLVQPQSLSGQGVNERSTPIEARSSMIQARDEKSEGLAVFLSFLWMGLGQMYVGRIGRGIVLAILGLLLGAPILLFLGMLFSPILVIFLPL